MKIRMSTVYLVLFVLGVIATGILTGIHGNSIGIWVSYSFLAAYGIMILFNTLMIEKISEFKVETTTDKEPLPESLGERKVEETAPDLDIPPKEPKKVQLSEEEIKRVEKVAVYLKSNLEKGHNLEKIREVLEKSYKPEFIDFVLQNAFKVEEPELPDMGEPEEIVTPETLDKEIKKSKKEFKCEKCEKVFKKPHLLKNHLRLSKKCQS